MRSLCRSMIAACLWIAPMAFAQPTQLQVVVLEGSDAANNIQTGLMVPVAVEVQDQDRRPVAGANVTFVYPSEGASGTFPGGGRTLTVATGTDGRASSSGVRAGGETGPLQVRVTASYTGQTATAVVNQTNISIGTAAGSPSGTANSTQTSRRGMSRTAKLWLVVALAAGAAAGGIVAATRDGGRGGSTPPPAPPPIVLTPGVPTVTGP